MNYWLFRVMMDSDWYPDSWEMMLNKKIAANNWPEEWVNKDKNAKANLTRFKKLKKGDHIIAALSEHRFAGYGVLTSGFYRGGDSFNIPHKNFPNETLHFRERFYADWTAIPLDRKPPFVDCHDLKEKFDIDLQHGFCVKQIDERTFNALKDRLDKDGAIKWKTLSISEPNNLLGTDKNEIDLQTFEVLEGEKYVSDVVLRSRKKSLIDEKKAKSDYRCEICGINFEEIYGDIGRKFIIAHHMEPIGLRKAASETTLSDIALVCANCHHMIHMRNPPFSIQEIKEKFKGRKSNEH